MLRYVKLHMRFIVNCKAVRIWKEAVMSFASYCFTFRLNGDIK